jgi:hypothetical protein
MGVVIGFVWLVIGYVLMQTSIQVWAALMLPNPVERAQQRIVRHPYASFFIGVGCWLASVLIASVFLRGAGPLSIVGYILMGPMFAASVVGGAGFSRILGGRITRHQRNESEITALIGGAFLTTAGTLLPVIGWFLFLPVVGFISIGSGFMGIVSRRRVAEERVVPVPQAAYQPAAWAGFVPQASPAPATWTEAPAEQG